MTFSLFWACAVDAMSDMPIATTHAADFMTVIWSSSTLTPGRSTRTALRSELGTGPKDRLYAPNRLPRTTSERMRTVGSDRELKLKENFIRHIAEGVIRSPVLPPHLAELAGPVGHHQRLAGIVKRLVVRMRGPVVASTSEPSTGELIIARHVVAERVLLRGGLLPPAPDQL